MLAITKSAAAVFAAYYIAFDIVEVQVHQQIVLFSLLCFGYMLYAFPNKLNQQGAAPAPAYPVAPPYVAPTVSSVAPTYVAPTPPVERRMPVTNPPHGQIGDEARAINRLFAERAKGDAGFRHLIESESRTPDYILYGLRSYPGTPYTALAGYCKQLANEIYKIRGDGEPVTCTLNEQPPYLKVSTGHRAPLHWASRSKQAPPHYAQLGVMFDGARPKLVAFDMQDAKQWFMGVFSSSGGGKSTVLRCAALSLLERTGPDAAEFYLIDLDSNQFDAWKRLPQVRFIATDHDEALALVQWLVNLVNSDRNLSQTVHRYLIIDELQILTADSPHAEQFVELLGQLAQRARKHGFSLIASTQDPSGDNFPSAMQRSVKIVAAGQTTDDGYLSRYLKVSGASALLGDGDFIVRAGARQHNFKSFSLTRADEAATIDAICATFGEDPSLMQFATEDEEFEDYGEPSSDVIRLQKPVVEMSGVAADAELIREYLDEALDENGDPKRGYAKLLIRVLYGEDKPNAGNYAARMTRAVKYANETF